MGRIWKGLGLKPLWDFLFASPRRLMGLIALACAGLLGFGLYLQHSVGLDPCPMCVVQRYAFVLVGVAAALGCAWRARWWQALWTVVILALSGFGAFVAARQSWMQWYPPEIASCGRDFYGIVENYPISKAIPMLFRGSGDCTAVDWSFLGMSIANWSFLMFVGIAAALCVSLLYKRY
ncbi:disulfide bond formation protein B [Allofranklinella schreckenbergeri]|uniref:Disulfide bond formation protein B n=1 Tax=Allofranklinella schreckenbergeri TaxID=1076744 RepID=A0A3M6QD12_9BURK|nr:disulfide bond formation protein B [Allofranklinella schreckenbergeri]RMX10469.1 disulfide bond formation protein B [Allofranklinella schreckenbergeri]